MSPQPSRSPDRFSLVALTEDHPFAPTLGDDNPLPCMSAQRGESNLRIVDCSGAHRDEEVAIEEILIPYAHSDDPDELIDKPTISRWWLSVCTALLMHAAILFMLFWTVSAPPELTLSRGELPTMQVSFVQLEKKAKPLPQPPAASPKPTPPKVEKTKPKPVEKAKPVDKIIPKTKPEPSSVPSTEPSRQSNTPSSTPSSPTSVAGQSTPGEQAAPSSSQRPAGLPTGSLTDKDIRPLRMDQPAYPRVAQAHGIEGRVKVLFTITSDGRVDNIQVLESVPARMFDREVHRAMAKWRFEPRVNGGKIVARQAIKMFFFKIEKRRRDT